MTEIGQTSGFFTAGTQDVDIKTLGGSEVPFGPLPVVGTGAISGLAGTLDVDIKTLGGSVVPFGPLPVDIGTTGTVEIGSWEAGTIGVFFAGTADVDIKTLGGSVVPFGPLPVDFVGTITTVVGGTLDVDIKTLGGSVVPFGPMPVQPGVGEIWNATCSTVHTDAVAAASTLTDDTTNNANFWIDTDNDKIYYPTMQHGFDGTFWDRIRTTSAMSGGTIDTGLLAVGRVPPADPVEKIALFTDAASTVAIWTPAAGNRWNLTDFVISAKNASDVTLYVGDTSTKAEFYLAAGGGVVMNLQTPFVATSTNTPLRISLTAATVSITTSGYETL